MMEEFDREMLYREYTASMQKNIVDLLGTRWVGEKWSEMPSFIEMTHPDRKPSPQTEKEQNDEAKSHVYEIFGITKEPERG